MKYAAIAPPPSTIRMRRMTMTATRHPRFFFFGGGADREVSLGAPSGDPAGAAPWPPNCSAASGACPGSGPDGMGSFQEGPPTDSSE
jgi:hypothetical protein